MKFTNLASTITSILTILSGLMVQLLHCTSTGDLAAVCTGDILPAQYMGYATIFFGGVTLLLKFLRPGPTAASLFGQTAVVTSTPGVGTVTPEQVKTP